LDREQTYRSLRRYLLEECYEAAQALDDGDSRALREELGDLLFQIVFLSHLAREDGAFTLSDVVRGIAEKLIRRHPHVFGSAHADSAAEVERHWDRIKRREKSAARDGSEPAEPSVLEGVPAALPALLAAVSLGERAARVGFDWERAEDVLGQLDSELGELRSALAGRDSEGIREELGDVLFTLAMLARRLQVDPEGALAQANRKFRRRFGWIERRLARDGGSVERADFETLERLWQESKAAIAEGPEQPGDTRSNRP
jgi:MazG family protein